jgi:hypothetical protein
MTRRPSDRPPAEDTLRDRPRNRQVSASDCGCARRRLPTCRRRSRMCRGADPGLPGRRPPDRGASRRCRVRLDADRGRSGRCGAARRRSLVSRRGRRHVSSDTADRTGKHRTPCGHRRLLGDRRRATGDGHRLTRIHGHLECRLGSRAVCGGRSRLRRGRHGPARRHRDLRRRRGTRCSRARLHGRIDAGGLGRQRGCGRRGEHRRRGFGRLQGRRRGSRRSRGRRRRQWGRGLDRRSCRGLGRGCRITARGGRERSWRQETERVDVALLVGRAPDPEVDARGRLLGRPTRAHRPDRGTLRDRLPLRDADRAEVDERHRIAVGGEDRHPAAVRGE